MKLLLKNLIVVYKMSGLEWWYENNKDWYGDFSKPLWKISAEEHKKISKDLQQLTDKKNNEISDFLRSLKTELWDLLKDIQSNVESENNDISFILPKLEKKITKLIENWENNYHNKKAVNIHTQIALLKISQNQ